MALSKRSPNSVESSTPTLGLVGLTCAAISILLMLCEVKTERESQISSSADFFRLLPPCARATRLPLGRTGEATLSPLLPCGGSSNLGGREADMARTPAS